MAIDPASYKHLVGMDPEDLTPKQMRMILRGAGRHFLMRAQQDEEEAEDNADEEDAENEDVVNLHAEHTGDSKPPPVTKSDLPHGVTVPPKEDTKGSKIANFKKGKK
jgi:hypothetical protein